MRNIFLEKSCTKCCGETVPTSFSGIEHITGSIIWNVVGFIFIPWQNEDYQNIFKLSRRPFSLTSCKAFSKNKKRSGTSFPASFSAWFLKENISLVLLYYLTKFHCLVAFTSWDIGQYVYCNCLLIRL